MTSDGPIPSNNAEDASSIADSWGLEEPGEERKRACGKGTHITVYTNGMIALMRFMCHRWDCPTCSAEQLKKIKNIILTYCSTWYVTLIGSEKYIAITKRIRRSGAKYLAIGWYEVWMIFTDKQVSKDFRPPFSKDLLERLIDVVVKDAPYESRSRRIRFSRNFFSGNGGGSQESGGTTESGEAKAGSTENAAAEGVEGAEGMAGVAGSGMADDGTAAGATTDTSRTKTHIAGKLLVREHLGQVLVTLRRHGYEYKWDRGDVGYFKGQLNKSEDVIENLEKNTGLHVIQTTRKRPN
jgi:hypothetical protein